MEITTRHVKDAAAERCGCLVLPVADGGKPCGTTAGVDDAAGGALKRLIRNEHFSGAAGKSLLLHEVPGIAAPRVLLLGCGDPHQPDTTALRKMLQHALSVLQASGTSDATFVLDDLASTERERNTQALQLALLAGASAYRYTHTLSKPDPAPRLHKIVFASTTRPAASTVRALAEGHAIATGTSLARELGNLPPNICTPGHLADRARALAEGHRKLTCRVLDEKKMASLGMGALLSVTAGTREPARLIVLEYRGAARDERPHVLVGKGITFDSGGISLKPGAGMDEMKFDMCGAASVLGTLEAIATLQPRLNVVGIVAAAENLPSGSATRPGDVVKSMAGTTIEVLNTDAEGRLILCDALTYARRFKPRSLVDIATLTGACVVALGKHASGLFSNDEELAAQLLAAGEATHDRAWRMPLWEDYQEQLKSNFADVANVGGPGAGSVTAACFLARFTREQCWAHLDIAGTAWEQGASKGATGRPVALLTRYLLDRAGSPGKSRKSAGE
ncbi:MAG: leucyl aminopeptidase [Pseudomonadales bacterium]|jgi:leucyl aminopeptidase|nr:leucyl aminopeptidase [Pseudomonadales bacterium]MCP5320784.1 leucyl aminopeptidase [Pseudomonadales bacterium]MCP5337583.1 leucyl aminopeptidase [Pseudomonadales bacterium]